MEKTIICGIFLVIVLLFFSGCVDNGSKTETSTTTIILATTTTTPGRVFHRTFSIVKPDGWKEVAYGTATVIYMPEEGELADAFSEKITLTVSYKPKGDIVSLDEMMDADIEETKKLLPDIHETVSLRQSVNVGPLVGLKTIYEYSVMGKTLETVQINAIQETKIFQQDIVYRVGHNCVKGECQYDLIFDDMLGSFESADPKD